MISLRSAKLWHVLTSWVVVNGFSNKYINWIVRFRVIAAFFIFLLAPNYHLLISDYLPLPASLQISAHHSRHRVGCRQKQKKERFKQASKQGSPEKQDFLDSFVGTPAPARPPCSWPAPSTTAPSTPSRRRAGSSRRVPALGAGGPGPLWNSKRGLKGSFWGGFNYLNWLVRPSRRL